MDLEMKEQLGRNRLCKQGLDAGIRKLPEDCRAAVCETISVLKERISSPAALECDEPRGTDEASVV